MAIPRGVGRVIRPDNARFSVRGCRVRGPDLRLLLISLLVGSIPTTIAGGVPRTGRSLGDKLRYGPGVANHPVNVIPSAAVRIPSGWPLAADGSITCLTCHHRLPSSSSGGASVYLREFDEVRSDSGAFCTKCHAISSERRAAEMHWLALRSAHIKPDTDRAGLSSSPEPHLLDAESRRCLSCHDGATATESRTATALNRGGSYLGDRQRNHPVGVDYPSRTPQNYSVPFRPPALLPESVRLPEGRVSCVSCHDLYANSPSRLSVPIEGSALCFTCHELD